MISLLLLNNFSGCHTDEFKRNRKKVSVKLVITYKSSSAKRQLKQTDLYSRVVAVQTEINIHLCTRV